MVAAGDNANLPWNRAFAIRTILTKADMGIYESKVHTYKKVHPDNGLQKWLHHQDDPADVDAIDQQSIYELPLMQTGSQSYLDRKLRSPE